MNEAFMHNSEGTEMKCKREAQQHDSKGKNKFLLQQCNGSEA